MEQRARKQIYVLGFFIVQQPINKCKFRKIKLELTDVRQLYATPYDWQLSRLQNMNIEIKIFHQSEVSDKVDILLNACQYSKGKPFHVKICFKS